MMRRIVLWLFLVAAMPLSGQTQDPVRVVIIYFSRTGRTKAMAQAVLKGASSVPGVTARLLAVGEARNEDVLRADAILLGSPVYNGNVSPPIQRFINQWPFEGAPLRDKVGAAFVTGGGISAGEELVQVNLLHSMMIFGMIIVGGPNWTQPFGASAVTEEPPFQSDENQVRPRFLEKAEALGRRVARIAKRLRCAAPR